MSLQRQQETGRLVPTLALQPLDPADAADNGLDALLKHCEVRIARQAIQHGVEVEAGFQYASLVRTLVMAPWQSIRASSAKELARSE